MPGKALPLDLDAYLHRIGYTGDRQPTLGVLNALHLAHATHIPFENLDILLGRPIRLDLASLQAKLVAGHRGGYCFEHNLLFCAVLEALGFAVRPLAARVRLGHPTVRARTHMLLMVTVADVPFIADVGFGGGGLLHPIPLVEAEPVRHYAWDFRLVREGSGWVLQSFSTDNGWTCINLHWIGNTGSTTRWPITTCPPIPTPNLPGVCSSNRPPPRPAIFCTPTRLPSIGDRMARPCLPSGRQCRAPNRSEGNL